MVPVPVRSDFWHPVDIIFLEVKGLLYTLEKETEEESHFPVTKEPP